MENGSFQKLNSTDIEFTEIEERPLSSRVLAQPHHQILDFTEIPRDVRKSGTVETLISQNEDLMARLKVTLRRMTSLEDENKNLHDTLADLKRSYASLSDQMLVWREKEKVWQERHARAENQLKVFHDRLPDYEKMEAQIDRLRRYQERVKSTIKPYLHQLKGYAQSLHMQIQDLNQELHTKDAEISNLQHQIRSLKEENQQQVQFLEMNQNDLVNSFEKEKSLLLAEIHSLQEANLALSHKSERLDQSLARQDDLENLVISLRRSKEESQNETQAELEALRDTSRELRAKLTEISVSHEDLLTERERLKRDLRAHQSRQIELEEQMTSLRLMWTSKSEENEKLQISIASLEKLNLELSSKLNELRKKN
jgi:chromosome segregation ATPase